MNPGNRPPTSPNVGTPNPKDVVGRSKVSHFVASDIGLLWTEYAMMDGAAKYGPYNYREAPVAASVYLDACQRHIKAWQDREERAGDSKAHHLGHACACLFIIMDAQAHGTLIDDRPKSKGAIVALINELHGLILDCQGTTKAPDPAPAPIVDPVRRETVTIPVDDDYCTLPSGHKGRCSGVPRGDCRTYARLLDKTLE